MLYTEIVDYWSMYLRAVSWSTVLLAIVMALINDWCWENLVSVPMTTEIMSLQQSFAFVDDRQSRDYLGTRFHKISDGSIELH